MTNYIVYYHKFKSTGKGYVGVTKHSIDTRLKQHSKIGHLFHKALKKYGVDDLESTVLHSDILDIDELKRLEIYYVEKYNTYYKTGHGYNMTLGGDSLYVTTKGKTYEDIYGLEGSVLQKMKMSTKQKGRVFSDEHKDKLKINHYNVTKENNPTFKYTYFLTPNDVLIKGTDGLQQTVKDYNIPHTLFSKKKIKQTTSNAIGWSYIETDSFDKDESEIIALLKEKKHKMWVDKSSDTYMFEKYKNSVTVITPQGDSIQLDTPDEMRKWCKENKHSFDRFSDIRRGCLSRVGSNSSLYGYKIKKGIQ